MVKPFLYFFLILSFVICRIESFKTSSKKNAAQEAKEAEEYGKELGLGSENVKAKPAKKSRHRWNKSKDKLLRLGYRRFGTNWALISKELFGSEISRVQCKDRFRILKAKEFL